MNCAVLACFKIQIIELDINEVWIIVSPLYTMQDVEIKKMGGNATYGFILYYDLRSAITAKRYMDGHNLKGNNIRVCRLQEYQ